ncbi:MAG: oxidoreductase, partial [Pseudolysinimonas sp.]
MIARLDTLLGKATMYRQVVYTLAVLQLLAVLFSALGLVGAGTPLEMVVSFAVLFVSTTLINLLFAATLRIRTHKLSSLITAQILFFLLAPPHLDEPLRLV